MRQEIVSLFNFIKYLLIPYILYVMYFCNIYLHVFFFSIAHFLKNLVDVRNLYTLYLDKEICIDIDSVQVSGYWGCCGIYI